MNQKNQKKDSSKKDKPLRNWVIFSGLAFQMGATIFIFAWLGKKLDAYFDFEKNWMTLLMILIALGVSLYAILKQLKKFNS
ncbi:MAG: AtpZ/AtpI family protein [Psychroflexus sp.]|nr:AtpZ/AtpI family protein [Psychroflexus sp.]